MRAPQGLRKLARTRVRLTRVRDAKIFNGRLVRIEQNHAWLSLNDPHLVQPSDTFIAEVHGPATKVLFSASYKATEDDGMQFEIGADIRHLQSSESARVAVEGFEATVSWSDAQGDHDRDGHLLDMSREGVCLAMQEAVARGTSLRITVTRKNESYQLAGIVRHCGKLDKSLGCFRVGVLLVLENRIQTGRWLGLFDRVIEAA